ncbi:protoglobin domain-containing protein [Methylomarinum vadi]|uniref:protoglobin domain-containing protein n=1 Tax=Methylomarinum vadi TaxID=438855 RepID=UPI0004DF2FCC|nr:protoglobin domain-containing protein [Methylomarinum vadi]
MAHDYNQLTQYAKMFTGLTPELEALLKEIGPQITPRLKDVTEEFYNQLLDVPEANKFLEGRVDALKATHVKWMEGLFTSDLGPGYTEQMYNVGSVHVKVNLPVEFMSGGMTLINNRLIALIIELFGDDPERCRQILTAISAVTGFSLITMQQSYQEATLAEELEKFLKISGMSRALFKNLADAYKA